MLMMNRMTMMQVCETSALAAQINNNPVQFSNYIFTVSVKPLSASLQAVELWDVSSGNNTCRMLALAVATLKTSSRFKRNMLLAVWPSALFALARLPSC